VRLGVARAEATRMVPPTVGVVVEHDAESTTVQIGGEPAWVAHYLAGLECSFEVLGPEPVRAALRTVARRLLRTHPPAAAPA
jgi:hypothetical protein